MAGLNQSRWDQLENWSPMGFLVGGLALLIAFVLVGVRSMVSFTVPELLITVFALPGMAIIFLVGLLGYYPYISEATPWLAAAGAVTSAIGGVTLILTTLGAIILHFTTQTGFTQAEKNPLFLGLFFVVLGTLFLSFLIYGVGTVWTRQPSLSIGILLLVAAVEPGSGLLFDVVGINLGPLGPILTLGIAALAMTGVGYLLRSAV